MLIQDSFDFTDTDTDDEDIIETELYFSPFYFYLIFDFIPLFQQRWTVILHHDNLQQQPT
jgi:hypothetical protein